MKKYKLGDIAKIYDGPHATPKKIDQGPIYLGINAVTEDCRIDPNGLAFLSEEDYKVWTKRVTPQHKDIVFSYEATLGRYAIIPENFYGCLGRRLGIVRVVDSKVNYEWLFYYFQSPQWKSFIKNHTIKGSTVDRISVEEMPNYEIPAIDINKQNRIALVLSTLDKRIENLRAQNRVLEQTAKTIYDYTFLQCAGHQTTYNKTLNRNIPVDWEVKCLGDLVRVSKESLNPQNYPEKQFKHFSIPSFDDNGSYSLEYGKDIFSNKFVVNNNHVLISKLNPWKNRAVWCDENDDAIGSTEFVTLLPHKLEDKAFVFSIVKSDSFIEYCSDAATGTSHSHRRVSPDIMMKFPIAYDEKTVAKFNAKVTPLFKKQLVNTRQIETLTTQRNTLLPLLMTGQIEV